MIPTPPLPHEPDVMNMLWAGQALLCVQRVVWHQSDGCTCSLTPHQHKACMRGPVLAAGVGHGHGHVCNRVHVTLARAVTSRPFSLAACKKLWPTTDCRLRERSQRVGIVSTHSHAHAHANTRTITTCWHHVYSLARSRSRSHTRACSLLTPKTHALPQLWQRRA